MIEIEESDTGKHITATDRDSLMLLDSILEAMTGNAAYSHRNARVELIELIESYHCKSCDGHSCDVP